MNQQNKNIELMQALIINGKISEVKKLVNQGADIHSSNDYFLYLAAFAKNIELQKYFIDMGLDPEATKGRLAVADPKGLEYLRTLKREKEIRDFAEELDTDLTTKDSEITKNKLKI